MNENYNITLLNTPADQLPENLRINVRSRIDHTLLDPAATKDQIITLCEEALEFGFASVCDYKILRHISIEFLDRNFKQPKRIFK